MPENAQDLLHVVTPQQHTDFIMNARRTAHSRQTNVHYVSTSPHDKYIISITSENTTHRDVYTDSRML